MQILYLCIQVRSLCSDRQVNREQYKANRDSELSLIYFNKYRHYYFCSLSNLQTVWMFLPSILHESKVTSVWVLNWALSFFILIRVHWLFFFDPFYSSIYLSLSQFGFNCELFCGVYDYFLFLVPYHSSKVCGCLGNHGLWLNINPIDENIRATLHFPVLAVWMECVCVCVYVWEDQNTESEMK